VLLVLLSGRMWARDDDGRRHDLTGPTWVVWFPGERLEYGVLGDTVHWVFARRTAPVPAGWPRPGSLVRVRARDSAPAQPGGALGTFVHPIDESEEGTGPVDLVIDVIGGAHRIYALADVVEVVEEADGDLHDRDSWPGDARPERRDP
jgi:hypothetical protein